jgi:Protein of unknown function (DUF2523)
MPILASIIGFLLPMFGSFVGRVLLALGFGFVEYVGIKTLVDYVIGQANAAFGGVAGSGIPGLLAWAGFFQLDVHLSIIISAVGVKIAFNSLGGNSVRRLVQK